MAEATVGVFCDDETIELAQNLLKWRDKLIEASLLVKKPMGVAENYKQWLIDAGFVNVKEEIYKVRPFYFFQSGRDLAWGNQKVPFSPWAKDAKMKDLGRYKQAMLLEALDAYSYALFTRVLGGLLPRFRFCSLGEGKSSTTDNSMATHAFILYKDKSHILDE